MSTQTRHRLEVDKDGTVRVGARKMSVTARLFLAVLRLVWWLGVRGPWKVVRGVARLGWLNRWHLAPVVGCVWVLTSAPAVVLVATSLTALLAVFGGHTRIKLGERMYLGRTERYAVAEGAIGAAVWTAGEWGAEAAGAHLPHLVSWLLYLVMTGHAALVWWTSRRPSWLPRRLTGEAKLYAGQWDYVAAVPGGLQDSYPIRPTIEARETGDVTFLVQLVGHHGEDVNDDSRKVVERTIKVKDGASLPTRSVQLTSLDHDVTQVRVTISPARALETEPVRLPEVNPVRRDGSLDLGAEASGRVVPVHAFAKDGTRHAMISGGSDAGKSNTLSMLLLPGLITVNDRGLPIETVWSLDGGKGTSTPYLAHAFDLNVTRPERFPIVLEMVFAVLESRESSRGVAGRHNWRTWDEEDQILTLLIQEAAGVAAVMTPWHNAMYHKMAARARKVGVRLIQESQDLSRGNIVGGELCPEIRKNLAGNGVVLAHRDGSADTRPLEGSYDAGQLTHGVNSLPPGGGWWIGHEQGRLLSARGRTMWREVEEREEIARTVTPRPLAGADLEAAMRVEGGKAIYDNRLDPMWTEPPAEDSTGDRETEALTSGPRPFIPVQAPAPVRDRVLRAITEAMAETGEPIGKTEILKRSGVSAGSWQSAKDGLSAERKIHQPREGVWAPGPDPRGPQS
jgi:hypothetical protein